MVGGAGDGFDARSGVGAGPEDLVCRVTGDGEQGERLSVRDVGRLLELSPQRISQVTAYKAVKADVAQLKRDRKAKRSRRISN